MCCFLDFHEIREELRITQNHVTNLRVSEHLAQSETTKTSSLSVLEVENKMPREGEVFRYLISLMVVA